MFFDENYYYNYEKKYESQVTDENPNPQDDHFVSLCMMELFIISVLLKQNPQKHIIFCMNHW